MFNRIKKLAAPALLLVMGVATGYGQGADATIRVEVGTQTRCPANWTTTFSSATLGNFTFDASATATFEATAVSRDGARASSTQKTISLEASAEVPELGTIS